MDKAFLLKANLIAVAVVGSLFAIMGVAQGNTTLGIVTFVGAAVVIVIVLIARKFLPIQVCIYMIATLAYFAMSVPPTIRGEVIGSFSLFVGFSIAFGLYFQRKVTLYLALLTNISLIFFIFVLGIGVPYYYETATIITAFVTLNVAFALLYILVNSTEKMLKRMNNDAQQKAIQAEEQNKMMNDLSSLVHEYVDNGDFEYSIDPSAYKEDYIRNITEGINSVVQASKNDMETVLSVLSSINEGNFDISVNQMPGKKIIINQSIDKFTENLNKIKEEILLASNAISNGDLHFESERSGYRGDWRNMLRSINSISHAVNGPVSEIKIVMEKLSQGQLDELVTGDYTGDFKDLKNTVNDTVHTFSDIIEEISRTLATIASGDLNATVTSSYQGKFSAIKESINNISGSLHKTMSEISIATDHVLSGASQISSSSMDLANGASQQASSIEELNASIDLINQQTKKNADNAMLASTLSGKSTENAKNGNEAMKEMLNAMLQIKESSTAISRINKVIQDIAFQTNLLALNAAVEAARAGEHGKGFAVVAEEVRSLAARSQNASEETTGMIEDSINRVDTGSGIAESTSDALNIIVDNADEVLAIINGISASSQEQADAVSNLVNGISQVSQVVQNNSAVSQQTASAAQQLNSQAELLREHVSYFKL